jgi:hypothetical protein
MGTFDTAAQELGALAEAVIEQSKSLSRQRELVEQLSSAVRRQPPNISAVRRLLDQPASTDLRKSFPSTGALMDGLRELAHGAWNDFALNVGADFRRLATAYGLPVDGQMPKFSLGRGIEVVFRLNENKTVVNGTTIQTVDPFDVFDKVRAEHERLWGGEFNADEFMAELYRAYREELRGGRASSEGVPIRAIYDRIQGDLPKSAKKAFGLEVFGAKLSRAMEAGARTSDGKVLELRPVREPRDAIYIYLPERGERAHRGLVSFREGRQ